eukprot:scaffold57944_cov25-Tisochrysis_lutea.AAC.1
MERERACSWRGRGGGSSYGPLSLVFKTFPSWVPLSRLPLPSLSLPSLSPSLSGLFSPRGRLLALVFLKKVLGVPRAAPNLTRRERERERERKRRLLGEKAARA